MSYFLQKNEQQQITTENFTGDIGPFRRTWIISCSSLVWLTLDNGVDALSITPGRHVKYLSWRVHSLYFHQKDTENPRLCRSHCFYDPISVFITLKFQKFSYSVRV